jgi:hypothetical protein
MGVSVRIFEIDSKNDMDMPEDNASLNYIGVSFGEGWPFRHKLKPGYSVMLGVSLKRCLMTDGESKIAEKINIKHYHLLYTSY